MPLPIRGWFTAATSWGDGKAQWNLQTAAILDSAVYSQPASRVLDAAGFVTADVGVVQVSGYLGATTDSLRRVSTTLPEGTVFFVIPAAGMTLNVIDGEAGDGGIDLHDGADIVLDSETSALALQRIGTRAREIRFIGTGTGGGGGGIETVATPVVQVTGNYTLTAADGFAVLDGTTLKFNTIRVRHATNQATAIDIIVPDSFPAGFQAQFHVADDQTGPVKVKRETSGLINGITEVEFAGPGASGWLFVHQQGPARCALEGEIAQAMDLAGQVVSNHRSAKVSLSGSVSLTAAVAPDGAVVVNSGAGATWTLPSRLASSETGQAVELTIINEGSGALTLTASGPTQKGDTSIGVDEMATVVWTHTGATERVSVASTG